MPEQSRQLAAIMFTDIVGYTALMGENEVKALELLQKNRLVQKPIIERYNGKWIKEIGDGVLASFNTVSDAVFCAVDIQKACESETDLSLRIGIHQGEVVFEGEDVFGDGVNIASRLEALAPAGGIWISDSVNRNIQNKQGIVTGFIREEQLKNVKEAVRIYEVNVEGLEYSGSVPDSSSKPVEAKPPAKSKRKMVLISLATVAALSLVYFFYPFQGKNEAANGPRTIAVLAFDDVSPDGDQEWLGDGMADEILNLLAKVDGLQVTGKTSSFSFMGKGNTITEIGEALGVKSVLEGSVSKVGNKLRITAKLIDVVADKQIWSNRYDRDASDIFNIMDEVAQNIASSLMGELSIEELDNIKVGYEVDPEAYDYYLKGVFFHYNKFVFGHGNEDFAKSEKMFINAILIDSTYVDAYAGLADLYDSKGGDQYDRKRDSVTDIGFGIDPNSAYILVAKGHTFRKYSSQKYNADSAVQYYMKAHALDSNFIMNNAALVLAFTDLGLYQNAINLANKILISNPLDIYVTIYLADDLLHLGKLEQAKQNYIEILEIDASNIRANEKLFDIALVYDGDLVEAKRILDYLKEIYPKRDFTFMEANLLAVDGKKEEALSVNKSITTYYFLGMNKEALSILDSMCVKNKFTQSCSYISLQNMKVLDFIREEPAFKDVLEEAKRIHEERVLKYGQLFKN